MNEIKQMTWQEFVEASKTKVRPMSEWQKFLREVRMMDEIEMLKTDLEREKARADAAEKNYIKKAEELGSCMHLLQQERTRNSNCNREIERLNKICDHLENRGFFERVFNLGGRCPGYPL